jgi:hypothetical protein
MIMQYGVIKKIQEDKNRDLTKANRHSETTKGKKENENLPRGRVSSRDFIIGAI